VRLAPLAELLDTARRLKALPQVMAAIENPGVHAAFFTNENIYFCGPATQFPSPHLVPAFFRSIPSCREWVQLHEGRTGVAAQLKERFGWTAQEAADLFNINADNVRGEAIKQRKRGLCPCCNRLLPDSPVPVLPILSTIEVTPPLKR